MKQLSPVARRFVLHLGEMGTRWGINRTVAQVHALLYLSPGPLPADVIAGALAVARSNVRTSLRELRGWGIVRVVHVLGDRRDHFEATTDVWEMFTVIVEQRKRRELDPILSTLRACLRDLDRAPGEAHVRQRLAEMLAFFESVVALYDETRRIPAAVLRRLPRLKGRLARLLGGRA